MVTAGLAALALAAPAAAQSPRSLDVVDSLIAEGRTEAARTALSRWMETARSPARADAQRALWQRALLTVDPTQAATDYQRLVVEYPGGPYSDRALLRLAQAAHARGEIARARALLASLLRDYPRSPTRLDAGALIESLPETVEAAPEPPTVAPTSAPPSERPTAAAAAESDPAPASESSAPPPAPPSDPASGRWTVQLGAFASPERALRLEGELRAGGVEARLAIVPDSRLIRVRAGRFTTQGEAERVREILTARGLTATVAGDADREEPAR